MRAPLILVLLGLVGCAANEPSDGRSIDAEAVGPRDGGDTICAFVASDGTPDDQCLAEWACPIEGVLTLACGAVGDAGIVCVCSRREVESTVVDVTPSSCVDEEVLTQFAQENCGWSWL